MRKMNHFNKALKILQELHRDYPNYDITQNIATATADYGDLWGMSEKEFVFALEKYQNELALDIQCLAPQDYVDKIVRDGEHLFDRDEEEEDVY